MLNHSLFIVNYKRKLHRANYVFIEFKTLMVSVLSPLLSLSFSLSLSLPFSLSLSLFLPLSQKHKVDLFYKLRHVMNELIDLRRQMLSGHLTQDQIRDVKRHVTVRLDWGNE